MAPKLESVAGRGRDSNGQSQLILGFAPILPPEEFYKGNSEQAAESGLGV